MVSKDFPYSTNLVSEGSSGVYLLTLFGKELIDWDPVIINFFWLNEHKN